MRGTNTLNRNEECPQGLISRLDTAQEGIRKSEDRSMKCIKKKDEKAKWRIPEFWDNFKRCNICITGISEGEKRRKQKK